MSSEHICLSLILLIMLQGCSSVRRSRQILDKAGKEVQLSLPSDEEAEKEAEEIVKEVTVDSTEHRDGPMIMKAIKDEQTGEMVATDVISASKVTARFRHVAERFGHIRLEFDVNVPSALIESSWQLRFFPQMKMFEDSTSLDPIFITGKKYRDAQLRGYERYRAFLESIITDEKDLIHLGQLEVFLERYFPETFAMKRDSSFISDSAAENYFGVSQRAALEHYKKQGLIARNERKKKNKEKMFHKYVTSPIVTEHIRLDTVIVSAEGDFIYRYVQDVESKPGLRKIIISLSGGVFEAGTMIHQLPPPEDLTFYVSSLSTLADNSPHYISKVIERNVYDYTLAFIDFAQGSSIIDTTLSENASELRRICKCIDDMLSDDAYEPDSIVVSASCSPEGSLKFNSRLAQSRSDAVLAWLESLGENDSWKLVSRSIPENWEMFEKMVMNDVSFTDDTRSRILSTVRETKDKDAAERQLTRMAEYKYLREIIYPKLRTVKLGFHMHRAGMIKDTIHTTEIDSTYMKGLEAMRNLDYKAAVTYLRFYEDYNCALALVAAAYNRTALEVLEKMDSEQAKVQYLMAVVLSRLGFREDALHHFKLAAAKDPAMIHRANLDPEISELIKNDL